MPTLPEDVYDALGQYVTAALTVDCFLDEEPEQSAALDGHELPFVTMGGDFDTDWNFETPSEEGSVTFRCYGLIADAKRLGAALKELFREPEDWQAIPVSGGEFRSVIRKRWGLHKEPERDKDNNPIYRYDVIFDVALNVQEPS